MRIEYRLLERAIRYALSAAGHTTPQLLTEPTPCTGRRKPGLRSFQRDGIYAVPRSWNNNGNYTIANPASSAASITF